MTQPNNLLTRIFQGAAVLAIAALFVVLGFWQLQRAADLKAGLQVARTIDTELVPLQTVAKPREALDAQAFNRTVSLTGRYIANFRAPNQDDGDGVVSDWEVALAQVDEGSAILVVRGLWSERLLNPEIAQSTDIDLTGVLVASQFADRANNTPGIISRLDSAVVVGLTDLDLYDGYILARSEAVQGVDLERSRVTEEKINPKIPGFYWQHLSYVVIWWLMAAVVLYLPFYRRRVTP
jgi:cytochrome oxidase assembly protein ShyY1|uniref:SURF1 family protein n=1 Tax=Candidatus Planktophila sp. TaxID=2175601 RepID=UPI0040497A35